MAIEVGDRVRVFLSMPGNQWELGKVIAIEEEWLLVSFAGDLRWFHLSEVEKLKEIPWSEITLAEAQRLAEKGIEVLCDGDTQTVVLVPPRVVLVLR